MNKLIYISFFLLFGIVFSGPTTGKYASLEDEIKEVMELLPKENISEVVVSHLKTDPGFQAAIKYFKSDEWKKMEDAVKDNADWVKLKAFIKTIGIDIDDILKCINKNLDKAEVPNVAKDVKKDLRSFLIDLEKNVPTLKIFGALNQKMIGNPKFREALEKLSSPEIKTLFDKARDIKEVKEMVKILEEMGVKINSVIDVLYSLLGWNAPQVAN
ncbi:unnamed protein product [Brassicogethes aeneus]|uniref:Protein G12 n=1 Tax=Brassicogethes aeneus TaxID=1431903 RepID=A0A9P0AUL1_BRAAE|nr:unnamed protein product [Brassicogethes aeneus]